MAPTLAYLSTGASSGNDDEISLSSFATALCSSRVGCSAAGQSQLCVREDSICEAKQGSSGRSCSRLMSARSRHCWLADTTALRTGGRSSIMHAPRRNAFSSVQQSAHSAVALNR